MNDSIIRVIASPEQQRLNQGEVYTDYGGQVAMTLPNVINRGAANLGLSVGSLGFFPAMDVMRQALPMVPSMLKMALVICIPAVLVIGTHNLKMLVTVSVVQFALSFVDFWFRLARWIDSTILDALYGADLRQAAVRELQSAHRAEQCLQRHAAQLRHGDDVHRPADVLSRSAWLGEHQGREHCANDVGRSKGSGAGWVKRGIHHFGETPVS